MTVEGCKQIVPDLDGARDIRQARRPDGSVGDPDHAVRRELVDCGWWVPCLAWLRGGKCVGAGDADGSRRYKMNHAG